MKNKAIAVGTFDGIHPGHKAVLSTLLNEADKRDLQPFAISFDRHPLSLIDPLRAPKLLMSSEDKVSLLEEMGITPLIVPFDKELQTTTAKQWLKRLHDEMNVRLLVAGYDNTFGSDGVNLSIGDFVKLGKETGIEVVEAPLIPGISSSEIRKCIKDGDILKANAMLGRNYSITGEVTSGKKIGRTIGFPTANVKTDEDILLPPYGVYSAEVRLSNGDVYPAMVNIGVNPTVGPLIHPVVEVHILDWTGDIYGEKITVFFKDRIRDEKTFSNLDELKNQLEKDKKLIMNNL